MTGTMTDSNGPMNGGQLMRTAYWTDDWNTTDGEAYFEDWPDDWSWTDGSPTAENYEKQDDAGRPRFHPGKGGV